ncbi:MAG TPA: DUF2214 family protein [Gemmatimonadales bacterium]|nr:DUF2214 family protein [Gemmatimonadales bacterium]
MLRLTLASLHLLALGIGLGAIWTRALAFRGPLDRDGLRRLLQADAWWGLAGLLWIGTGLARLFLATEKATGYYLQNHVFWTKMALLVGLLALELGPMVTLIRWRVGLARGETPRTDRAGRFAAISFVQAGLVVLMLLAAAAMARGYGVARG